MKIFGIGLQKTGGTSLISALDMLGYEVIQSPREMLKYNGKGLGIGFDLVEKYDYLSDIPIPLFYKELDKAFPNSKFIMTSRSVDSWLKSAESHFSFNRKIFRNLIRGRRVGKYVAQLFGTECFNSEKYLDVFNKHESDVKDYFSGREKDLLCFNIFQGDGWRELCSFLDKPLPNEGFPVKNKKTHLKNLVLSDWWMPNH